MKSPLNRFWAKVAKNVITGKIINCLSLRDHSIDVSLVFRALTRLPILRNRLEKAAGGALCEEQLDKLAVIALLHDFGKANLGFQGKIRNKGINAGHIRETFPLFCDDDLKEKFFKAIRLEVLRDWFSDDETLSGFIIASLSHHGSPVKIDCHKRDGKFYRAKSEWWRPVSDCDPLRAVAELMEVAGEIFPLAFGSAAPPISDSTALQHRFAGLVMLADWLGSHEGFFPYNGDIQDRIKFSIYKASKALSVVGIDSRNLQKDLSERNIGFKELFGFFPRPSQKAVGGIPATEHLLIIEDETGSGKTEAALTRFFSLFSSGEVGSLYFALPTRVAARELYTRVLRYVEKAFPDKRLRPITLLAVPGYAKVDGVDAKILLPDAEKLWNDDIAQYQRESSWAAERPKRFLASTIAVGTIDQALLSALQTPHAHLRSVCLDRSLLVVDEVHASDPYMRHLLKSLVHHHLELGGHAMLLSATLGSIAKSEFLAIKNEKTAIPNFEEAAAAPYPSITQADGKLIVPTIQNRKKQNKKVNKVVKVELSYNLFNPESLLPVISGALLKKARVLVVMNTVDRAIRMQRSVESAPNISKQALFTCGNVISPHHGRFAPVDRETLDEAVTARFGKDSRNGPMLLIGTQTLEQSLDIDADFLITDLCPMDVLLQRIGRLHRHYERSRPGEYDNPRCIVLIPADVTLDSFLTTDGKAMGKFKKAGLGSVYEDMRVLFLTIKTLMKKQEIELPTDNRWLVESATHPDLLNGFKDDRWVRHGEMMEGGRLARQIQAHYHTLTEIYSKPFGAITFSELGEKARTRLGLDDRRIRFPEVVNSPFGKPLDEIVIPGHMADKNAPEEDLELLDVTSMELQFRHGNRKYIYSRFGLEGEK